MTDFAHEWIAKQRHLSNCARDSRLALDALEASLGMADAGAITSRARGDSEEERRWLDFRITIETMLRDPRRC